MQLLDLQKTLKQVLEYVLNLTKQGDGKDRDLSQFTRQKSLSQKISHGHGAEKQPDLFVHFPSSMNLNCFMNPTRTLLECLDVGQRIIVIYRLHMM